MRKQLEEALINAAILAGLGFFYTLAGMGAVGLLADPKLGILAALIVAGLYFFTRLASERGINTPKGG